MAVAGLAVVALGAGVAAQTTSPAAPATATEPLNGAMLPHDISSVSVDLDQGRQTPAQHPEEELLGAQEPTPPTPQGEQSEVQQGEQGEGQQTEPPQDPQSTAAAVSQELLTPAEREALALVEQMIRDQEGVLMGTGFSYAAAGRRDPFVSLVPNTSLAVASARPYGLPGFTISEVNLKAIASAQGRWHAMVVAPNQKAYFLVVGAQLFDGHVMEIRPGEVIFEQVVADLTGARLTRQVTKRLRTTDGGGETP